MIYIVPTRGRPQNARALIEAWRDTGTSAELIFALDEDDPTHSDYVLVFISMGVRRWHVTETDEEHRGMVYALNSAAMALYEKTDVVGFMGDDHRPRTSQWDSHIAEAIARGALLAYGNDLAQGKNLATAVAVRSDVVAALGGMCPSALQHLYVDNYWMELGRGTGRMTYVPEAVIEHMHPIAGKAEWDDGYRRVNAGTMYQRDHDALEEHKRSGRMAGDILKLRELP